MLSGISGAGSYSTYYMNPYRAAARGQGAAALAQQSQNASRTGGASSAWTVRRPSNLNTPVQPVDAVKRVNPDAQPVGIDQPLSIREGADPAEMAVRMRITPYQEDEAEAGLGIFAGDEDAAAELGVLAKDEEAIDLGVLAKDEEAIDLGVLANEEDPAKLGIFAENEDEKDLGVLADDDEDTEAAQGAEAAQEAKEEGECQTCEKRKYQDGSDDSTVSFQTPTNIKPGQVASAVRGHEMEHVLHEQAKAKQEGRKVVSQSVTLHTAICPECGKVYISGGETRTTTKANPEKIDAGEEEGQEPLRKTFSVFG